MANDTTDQPTPLDPGQGETNDPTDASETATVTAPEGAQTEGTPVDTGTDESAA